MTMESTFMTAEKRQVERVEWCDIYKGILILLVVIGHATGRFNQYIYQFHIAAFFFISGFTGNAQKSSIFQKSIQKFYKLLAPYMSIGIVGIWMFWLFDKLGFLNQISMTNYPESFQTALTGFCKLEFSCDWLGAMWFLPVLCFAEIIFYTAAKLCRNDVCLTFLSILLFFYGYKMRTSGAAHYSIDLACAAQVFILYGYLAKKVPVKMKSRWHLISSSILIVVIWQFAVRNGFNYTVDWPVRKWNGAVDLVLPVFGILLTINIAKWIATGRYVKQIFLYFGKNSMGIMCFHFIGFKAAYFVCVLLKAMKIEDLYMLTPPEYVSSRYWILLY